MKRLAAALVLLASCAPAAPAPGPDPAPAQETPQPEETKLLKFDAPKGWTSEEPSNRLRKVQYRVPDKQKTAEDAEFFVSFFRISGATVQDNLRRWGAQMGVSAPTPQVIQGAFKCHFVDLLGSYAGDAASDPIEKARMLAAIVETEDGPWYFKFVGPADTVGDWREEFVALLRSIRP